jgi:hypothetical protein
MQNPYIIPKLKQKIQHLSILNLLIHTPIILLLLKSPTVNIKVKFAALTLLMIPIMCIYGCRKEYLWVLMIGAFGGLFVAIGYMLGVIGSVFVYVRVTAQG